MPRKRNEEAPSFLSTLSESVQESSLLILDAYEHRLREGKTVSPASLEELQKELDKTPSFEGSLEVTLRLLKLKEKAKARDASTSSTTNDNLTSLRPPSPKVAPSPRSPTPRYAAPPGPFSSPMTTKEPLHPWYDSPCSTDYSERDLLQPGWCEEEEDEQQLARRRSQVRVRRLPSSRRVARHPSSRSSRRRHDTSYRDTGGPLSQPATNTLVQFKDQAQSVIDVTASPPQQQQRDQPPPARAMRLQGGPTPDYQVQFKDQAQSVVLGQHHHQQEVIPVAIAVPVFDDEEPRRNRSGRRSRRQPRSMGYQLMSI